MFLLNVVSNISNSFEYITGIKTFIRSHFQQEDGRQPILMFMEKPSKKLYPDYYQVIAEPIDMLTIESNIKNEKYSNMEELVEDFKVM